MPEVSNLSGTAPLVCVSDVKASLAFYTNALNFEQVIINDKAGYALVRRGNLLIAMIQTDDKPALVATATNVAAQLWMDDVAGYWDSIKGHANEYPSIGITGPVDRDYGVRELHIKDPDGFLMFFTDTNDLKKGN